ncbi:MAG: HAMP domain-containing sensor histidine kinase [Rhizomicrobium sp.]|nr:HAMP domain-containing sensor histidine kinase [Rhizomicrobium sp.]
MHTRLFRSESFRQAAIFAVLYVFALAALFTAVFLILDHSFKANLLREVDDDLASIRAAYVINDVEDKDHETKEVIEGRLRAPDADDAYLLQRGTRRIAGNIAPMPPQIGTLTIKVQGDHGTTHRLLGRGEMVAPGAYAFVARDLEQMDAAERGILYAFGSVLVASMALAGIAGLFLSAKFIGRIDAVTTTCRNIMAGQLGERIPPDGRDDEFSRLGGAVNAMLDRIQLLMESLRQVSNDIAHDMRTPLTHLRNKLERARDSSTAVADYAGAVDGAIADCDKLLDTFAALLRIAEIEAGAKRAEFDPIDLTDLITKAGEIYAPVMEDTEHHFVIKAEPVELFKGDHQLLLQLVSNLLNNAITHTPKGCLVALSCRREAGRAVLCVSDNGPGIAVSERAAVLRRFYRGEQSRTTPGSGLGLALVAAVAELHGAELELSDNKPGLSVFLRFALDHSPSRAP